MSDTKVDHYVLERDASFGIMKITDLDDLITYQIGCDCGSKDCITDITFEVDNEGLFIEVSIEKKLFWTARSDINEFAYSIPWFKRIIVRRLDLAWKRIKGACSILFKGYLEVNGQILFRRDEHLDKVIECFQLARERMHEKRKEYNEECEASKKKEEWSCQ